MSPMDMHQKLVENIGDLALNHHNCVSDEKIGDWWPMWLRLYSTCLYMDQVKAMLKQNLAKAFLKGWFSDVSALSHSYIPYL